MTPFEQEVLRVVRYQTECEGGARFPSPVPLWYRGVVELDPRDPKATVCGTCGRGWDDRVSTSCTPVPSGRCPFEYDHNHEEKETP